MGLLRNDCVSFNIDLQKKTKISDRKVFGRRFLKAYRIAFPRLGGSWGFFLGADSATVFKGNTPRSASVS